MSRKRIYAALGALVLAGAFIAGYASASPISGADTKTNCITVSHDGPAYGAAALATAEANTGVTFGCLNTFANPMPTWADWESPWQFSGNSSWTSFLDASPTHQVILGMDLVPWSATGTTVAPVGNPLTWEQQGAAGAFNAHATQLAKNLVADGAFRNGQPLIIRLGIEANGNWEADWVGTTATEAADWAKTYANEVAAMRAVPGTNFRFAWNPNACYSVGVNNLAAMYPGNGSVDIIGADLYDADCTVGGAYAGSEGFAALASHGTPSFDAIEAFAAANSKPFAVGEWGLEHGDDPAYVSGIAAAVNSRSTAYQAYFDNGNGAQELTSSTPLSDAAYKAGFGRTAAGPPPPSPTPVVTWTPPRPPSITASWTQPPGAGSATISVAFTYGNLAGRVAWSGTVARPPGPASVTIATGLWANTTYTVTIRPLILENRKTLP
jgi:hypothetical protein